MKTGIIYCITNTINGKRYIGQTKNELNKRWKDHLNEAKKYNTRPLYRAINKYGTDVFKIKIIEECNIENLNEKEAFWIKKLNTFNNGYNATSGGDHFDHSDKTKDKISITMTNIERNDNWRKNSENSLKHKVEKGELWGFLKGNHYNHNKLKRKVKAINLETGEETIFESMNNAAYVITGNKKCASNISNAIKNGFNVYGYKWEKIDNTPTKISVIGIHKRTEEIIKYESMSAAAFDLTGDPTKAKGGLRKSLSNPGKNSWMGYYWYYQNS
jgi:group I intron endonuclease